MIRTGGRGVDGVEAVLQNADAVAIKTADDGAAGGGAEVGAADAGHAGQGLAKAGFDGEGQVLAAEDGGGLGLLEQRTTQRSCNDHFVHGDLLVKAGGFAESLLNCCVGFSKKRAGGEAEKKSEEESL